MNFWKQILGSAVIFGLTMWAYWPTLVRTVVEWERQPDYSHGFLVVPIAVFFLWARRDQFPVGQIAPSFAGLAALLLVGFCRVLASVFYLEPLDGWTLPLWIAAAVLLLFGARCLWWSLPSIVFLWFMIPLPWSIERWLSIPLQGIATTVSTAALLLLGQPAIAEGNTIWVGDHRHFVEEACSGLRIFVGVFALAFAYVLFSRWAWWQKALVVLAAAPVALVANATRIVATALLNEYASGDAARRFNHDFAGIVMIPFAAVLFWGLLVFLTRLLPQYEEFDATRLHQVVR
jgi:exosortase